MVTANELRIGNCFIGYNNKIFKWGLDNFELINHHCHIDEIIKSPIPLTPEILEKCDDPLSKIGYELRKVIINGCIRLHLHIGISYIQTADYLHEYQNLVFALTGQELEVKL